LKRLSFRQNWKNLEEAETKADNLEDEVNQLRQEAEELKQMLENM
jgi:hypothetical protein